MLRSNSHRCQINCKMGWESSHKIVKQGEKISGYFIKVKQCLPSLHFYIAYSTSWEKVWIVPRKVMFNLTMQRNIIK
jgi:hypothetical protein